MQANPCLLNAYENLKRIINLFWFSSFEVRLWFKKKHPWHWHSSWHFISVKSLVADLVFLKIISFNFSIWIFFSFRIVLCSLHCTSPLIRSGHMKDWLCFISHTSAKLHGHLSWSLVSIQMLEGRKYVLLCLAVSPCWATSAVKQNVRLSSQPGI